MISTHSRYPKIEYMAAQEARIHGTRLKFSVLALILFASLTQIITAAEQPREFQEQLKRLNKPALKSIQSPDGDIIDCVDISQQPAFDHPMLKNHTIQLKPPSRPQGTKDGPVETEILQMWHQTGERCPENTVPIRRTKMEDLLRASSLNMFAKKQPGTIPQPNPTDTITRDSHEYAIAYAQATKYYGTSVTINVWKPRVQQPDEFSLSQIWLIGGSGDDYNSIEAGVQVYKQLYGDDNTRLFVFWTSDNYRSTGCYNLACSGFVQTNNNIVVGATVSPVSIFDGTQYAIKLLVWKAPNDGNWWLNYQDQDIGYWPAILFSSLKDSAFVVEWGGEIVNSKSDGKHTSTEMGSGHFATEGFGKASFFKNIEIVDESNALQTPPVVDTVGQRNCYDIKIASSSDWGFHFYYGGPGRNPQCQ